MGSHHDRQPTANTCLGRRTPANTLRRLAHDARKLRSSSGLTLAVVCHSTPVHLVKVRLPSPSVRLAWRTPVMKSQVASVAIVMGSRELAPLRASARGDPGVDTQLRRPSGSHGSYTLWPAMYVSHPTNAPPPRVSRNCLLGNGPPAHGGGGWRDGIAVGHPSPSHACGELYLVTCHRPSIDSGMKVNVSF